MVLGAEGWSVSPHPSELTVGGFNRPPRPLRPPPGSLSAEGHEDGDEEAEDEAVLLWVKKC